jgi:Bacterial Ig-like domain
MIQRKCFATLGLTVVLLVLGCGTGSSNSGGTSTANEPLAVVSTVPVTGATNVPLSQCPQVTGFCGATFTMTFNKEVNMDTLKFSYSPFLNGYFACPSAGPGTSGCLGGLPGSGVPPDQSSVVIFVDGSNFQTDTTYQITLDSVSDTNGNLLGQSYTWSFTTALQ